MIETITIRWELLGARLAALTSDEQAAFFNGFAAELDHYDSRYKAELQLGFVNSELTTKARATLKDLLPMLWVQSDEDQ